MTATRRGFLFGLGGLIAAPAIVKASSLMDLSPVPFASYRYATRIAVNPDQYIPEGFPARYLGLAQLKSEGRATLYDPWKKPVDWPAAGTIFAKDSAADRINRQTPRLTMTEITRWNDLRSRTGMRMEPILG